MIKVNYLTKLVENDTIWLVKNWLGIFILRFGEGADKGKGNKMWNIQRVDPDPKKLETGSPYFVAVDDENGPYRTQKAAEIAAKDETKRLSGSFAVMTRNRGPEGQRTFF